MTWPQGPARRLLDRQQQGLTVHEVTKRTGLSRKALRLYEERGLVIPGRTDAGYRVYDGVDLGRLELIRRARTLEMSTSDRREFLDIAVGCCDRDLDELVALVEDKRHGTEQRLAEPGAPTCCASARRDGRR